MPTYSEFFGGLLLLALVQVLMAARLRHLILLAEFDRSAKRAGDLGAMIALREEIEALRSKEMPEDTDTEPSFTLIEGQPDLVRMSPCGHIQEIVCAVCLVAPEDLAWKKRGSWYDGECTKCGNKYRSAAVSLKMLIELHAGHRCKNAQQGDD